MTTILLQPPFPNSPPILVQQKLNVFSEVVQQVAILSFNKLQHLGTFVEQQMLHDVEPCVTGLTLAETVIPGQRHNSVGA